MNKLIEARTKQRKIPGVCCYRGCDNATTVPQAKWCKMHKKEVKAIQVAANNERWKRRVAMGVAGHHLVYDGQPTPWAQENPRQALMIARAGRASIDANTLSKLLKR